MDMVLIAFDTQLQSSIEICQPRSKTRIFGKFGAPFLKKMDILARCGISLGIYRMYSVFAWMCRCIVKAPDEPTTNPRDY